MTGFTGSPDFPTAHPLQPMLSGDLDAFVVKFTADGTALVYGTYLGGRGGDGGFGIAVDTAGAAYVTGDTNSPDFPTVHPVQPTLGGGVDDAFVAKLNAAGSALVYATYLGGSGQDEGRGIAVDATGAAYVTGITNSPDFPTVHPLQPAYGGGDLDAFVAKLAELPATCPQGQGFWKNHPGAWPVTSLTLGSQTYTRAALLALFDTPPGGDASLILADQLIAAKLNIANGADPTPISATIADADHLLSGFTGQLPYHVRPSSASGKAMVNDASVLESYNNGELTPDCTP